MSDSFSTARLTLEKVPVPQVRALEEKIGTRTLADHLETLPESVMARIFDDPPLLDRLAAMHDASEDEAHTLAYLLRKDGEPIGYASFLSFGTDCPEAQIALLPDFRGYGYAREAMEVLLDALFSEGAVSVLWRTLPDNAESISLARRLGGIKEPCEDETQALLFTVFRITK